MRRQPVHRSSPVAPALFLAWILPTLTGCGTGGDSGGGPAPYVRGVCLAEAGQCGRNGSESQWPASPTGSLADGAGGTYAVTAVADNLDPGDLDIVAKGLQRLGLGEMRRDMDVSFGSLTDYLAQKTSVLYHTGHGSRGGVHTSSGGPKLTASSVDIQAEYTVFATCLTLADAGWRDALAPRARGLFGYTDKSFDKPTDDTVAKVWVEQLARGRSPLQAWYLANANVSLLMDRWAAYVREQEKDDGVVEFSARSAATPKTRSVAHWLPLGRTGRLRVADHLLSRLPELPSLPSSLQVVAGTAPVTHVSGEGPFLSAATPPPSRDDAESIAIAWLDDHGGLPEDAFFDGATAVEAATSDGLRQIAAYAVRFGRARQGLPIRGNGVEDHITLLVTSAGVAAASQYWPEIRIADSTEPPVAHLSPMQVLDQAADEVARVFKGDVFRVEDMRPVLGTPGQSEDKEALVPAYELRGADGAVIVDARTGFPL